MSLKIPAAVLFAALLMPLAPLSAFAAAATASANVNVRSGPEGSYSVVGQLRAGEAVDISKCQGTFCYISFGGTSGWVSASYLTRDSVAKPAMIAPTPQVAAAKPFPPAYTPAPPTNLAAADSSDFNIPVPGDVSPPADIPVPKADVPDGALLGPGDETDAGSFTIPAPSGGWDMAATGEYGGRFNGFRPRLMAEAEGHGEACFFEGPDFAGAGFCLKEGQSLASLGRWTDRIVSIRNPDGLKVSLCTETGPGCRVYAASTGELPDFGELVSSITVGAAGY
jgi:uncharacterized protein YraI